MALKAGYNGIKKNVLDKLLQMSGALIIKSLGTALSLSDAGELRVRNASDSHSGVVQPDGVTISVVDGKLVAQGSGLQRENVFTGEAHATGSVTLTSSIENANFIEFVISDNTTYRASYVVAAETLRTLSEGYSLGVWDYQSVSLNRIMNVEYVDSTHINIKTIDASISLVEVNAF